MGTTTTRNVQIEFSGDVSLQLIQSALPNENALAAVYLVTLPVGDNPLPAPFVEGNFIVSALTIIPPAGNTITITLKGETTDVGIPLHPTDPTTIALPANFVTSGEVVLSVATQIDGVQLIWT